MKQKRTLCGCVTAALILLLCAQALAADGFALRNGITWDTTADEMMEAESVHVYDASFRQHTYNGFAFYYVLGTDADAYDDVYYVYRDDLPVMIYTTLPPDTKAVSVYDETAEANTARYGEPAEVSVEALIALLSIVWPDNAVVATVGRATAWRLADGTLAALFCTGDFNYMSNIHESRLAAALTAAD
jgi:hypothetical protein